MKQIKILWTGGWDSSFRMCQLSRMPVEVQPIYIKHPRRLSTNLELEAMKKIRSELIRKPETKAKILPVKVLRFEDIFVTQAIKDAYKKVRQLFPKIGGQYQWLAAVGENYPGIELGEEHYRDKPGTLWSIFLATGGGLRFDSDNVGHLFSLDKDVNLILGNFSYPIASYTELEMLKIIKDWHYEDVMQHVWFCQYPIDGKPCGVCTPCQIKMKAGMEWMLPKDKQIFYKIFKYLESGKDTKAIRFQQFVWDGMSAELKMFSLLGNICKDIKGLHKNKIVLLNEIKYFNNLVFKFRGECNE